MIEINLLPHELQLRNKQDKIELSNLLYIIPVIFGLLLLAHLFLAGVNIYFNLQLGGVNKKWGALEADKKRLEVLKKEYSSLSEDSTLMQQLLKERITWADKLNLLSQQLPSGVWFNELSINAKELTLKGSVISLDKQELGLINKFLSSLKTGNFSRNFNTLELGSVQREMIGTYEIVNFSINGALK